MNTAQKNSVNHSSFLRPNDVKSCIRLVIFLELLSLFRDLRHIQFRPDFVMKHEPSGTPAIVLKRGYHRRNDALIGPRMMPQIELVLEKAPSKL